MWGLQSGLLHEGQGSVVAELDVGALLHDLLLGGLEILDVAQRLLHERAQRFPLLRLRVHGDGVPHLASERFMCRGLHLHHWLGCCFPSACSLHAPSPVRGPTRSDPTGVGARHELRSVPVLPGPMLPAPAVPRPRRRCWFRTLDLSALGRLSRRTGLHVDHRLTNAGISVRRHVAQRDPQLHSRAQHRLERNADTSPRPLRLVLVTRVIKLQLHHRT
jgi:hypothetical protein